MNSIIFKFIIFNCKNEHNEIVDRFDDDLCIDDEQINQHESNDKQPEEEPKINDEPKTANQ